jgi:hypothetical protein
MILNKMIAAVGLVGTLGAATPAFADWHRPAPVVTAPGYSYAGWGYGHRSYGRGYSAPRYYHPYARRGWEGSRWREPRGHHYGYRRW